MKLFIFGFIAGWLLTCLALAMRNWIDRWEDDMYNDPDTPHYEPEDE